MTKRKSSGSAGRKPATRKRPPRTAETELVIGPAVELSEADPDPVRTAIELVPRIPKADVRAMLPVLRKYVTEPLTKETGIKAVSAMLESMTAEQVEEVLHEVVDRKGSCATTYDVREVAEVVDLFEGLKETDAMFSCADFGRFIHNNGGTRDIVEAMFAMAPIVRRVQDRITDQQEAKEAEAAKA